MRALQPSILCAAAVVAALVLPACQPSRSADDRAQGWPPKLEDSAFWEMVRGFSEAGAGYQPVGGYRSDNLVSNERSLQHVMPMLASLRQAGAYIGVGPEQNFTYVVALEPAIAFVIDIRRENQLLHLLYKALAETSADRAEFLSRLFARPRPAGLDPDVSVQALFAAFDAVERSAELEASTRDAVLQQLAGAHGFSLTDAERQGIASIYSRVTEGGPLLRWDATGGAWIPSYAELMTAGDYNGIQRSYLASEAAFQTFRRYQLRNQIVPLVGDFGGTVTLAAVGRYLATRDQAVAVFYTSNVEPYLRNETRAQFIRNVAALPRLRDGLLVRTTFHRTGETAGLPDFETTTLTEPLASFVASEPR